MSDTDRNGTAPSRDATGSMDPYGARAMRYVQDHCPTRFPTINDPVGFFTALGQEIRDPGGGDGTQVEVTEEAIMAAETVPGEEFTETLGRWKTARGELVAGAAPPPTSWPSPTEAAEGQGGMVWASTEVSCPGVSGGEGYGGFADA